jgi:hypothetical protein
MFRKELMPVLHKLSSPQKKTKEYFSIHAIRPVITLTSKSSKTSRKKLQIDISYPVKVDMENINRTSARWN